MLLGGHASDEPKRCVLEPPSRFRSFDVSYENRFAEKRCVEWPRGIQTTTQITHGGSIVDAPYPLGPHHKRCLDGYVSANGVSYFSSAEEHNPMDGSHLAESIMKEMNEYATHATSTTKLQTRLGPKRSIRSRGVAITMLLPKCIPGKDHANRMSMMLTNALGLIAASPCKHTNANRKQPAPAQPPASPDDEVARAFDEASISAEKLESNVPKTTSHTRLAVLCTTKDISSYVSYLNISTVNGLWNKKPALAITYFVPGSRTIRSTYVPIDEESGLNSPADAVEAIQEACSQARMHEHIDEFTFPPAFLAKDAVAGLDEATENSFLHFQQALRRKFKDLYVADGVCQITAEEQENADVSVNSGVWLRVCPNSIPWIEADENHHVGMLFSTYPRLLDSYIKRCACEEQAKQNRMIDAGLVFTLLDPDFEESKANLCIVWVCSEECYIGDKISLYAPSRGIGDQITPKDNCHVDRVVPLVSSVSELRKYFHLIPVEQGSIVPRFNHNKAVQAFLEVFEGGRKKFGPGSANRLPSLDLSPSTSIGTSFAPEEECDATGEFYSSLLLSKLGHPCTSLGSALDVLSSHRAETRIDSAVFHSFLQTAARIHGVNISMNELMKKAESALVSLNESNGPNGDRCASPYKRSRTPVTVPEPKDDEEDKHMHLMGTRKKAYKLMELCECVSLNILGQSYQVFPNEFAIGDSREDCSEFCCMFFSIFMLLGNRGEDDNKQHVLDEAIKCSRSLCSAVRCLKSVGAALVAISSSVLKYSPSCDVVVMESSKDFERHVLVSIPKTAADTPCRMSVAQFMEKPIRKRVIVWAHFTDKRTKLYAYAQNVQ